ncbi:tRNA (uridine(54)-C5)-methyltransferase TrmA [Aliidiomarina haloalkalitolerans]|uniref:tRNA/tmRNA (uracil-C(5))-methyltransferase n=1 Tax=Aliidiomarina haloalkalitolerans TaxID=859059 RepID=A0A432VV52_9GAMM|nr:tRNA (uridine(54)-C5)-methyltransferase TrmA [Aliidiomarina haloalkalitolerans]RUO20331.1 tRNA (uridine(54)-C5)-methyltransferase TrmA [Aliidiomarina haloalkalitolerans]
MAVAHTQAEYRVQFNEKKRRLEALLTPFAAPALDCFESAAEHYRMRAEFRVWHEGDDLYYVMFNSDTKEKYRVEQLPAANRLINQLMPAILDYVRDKPNLRQRLFQVDFLTTTTNEAVISLLYHRQLDDQWQSEIAVMRNEFQKFGHIDFIGRARKQKIVCEREAVTETLHIDGRPYYFEHIENSFTQPNATVNQRMISWAKEVAKNSQRDLLELYCGNGNFSIPLAESFRRVFGTEISRTSVQSAQHNIALNQVENVRIERLAAEDCSAIIQGGELPGRLKDLELNTYDFGTVLVDPPRAGLDQDTVAMVSQFDHIIYISCNPETLAENLSTLQKTHQIERAAFFDQFPFTPHIEAGVYLTRK